MNLAQIEEIMGILRDSRLVEIDVRQAERTIRLRRASVPVAGMSLSSRAAPYADGASSPAPAPDSANRGAVEVTASLVGIFRLDPAAVAEDMVVRRGQVLGQIESMRLMTDCLAPIAGRIMAIYVEDEQPVEYGQPLFEIVEEAAE